MRFANSRERSLNFKIAKGLDVALAGAPRQAIFQGPEIASVALTRADLRGAEPDVLVQEGERVALGQPVCVDRHDRKIAFVAPAAGWVRQIEKSRRRSFQKLEIACEGLDAVSFETVSDVSDTLQQSGLWTTFTARPFGKIPRSDDTAEAILVTAIDTDPLAADPCVIIEEVQHDFEMGLEALASLKCGTVIVCQGPGDSIKPNLGNKVEIATFSGPHPAGLPGTHLDCLGFGHRNIWQIGYQDVLAIGYLMRERRLPRERIVALGGPMARNPRLVRTLRGASLGDLTRGEAKDGACTILSGSALSGRPGVNLGWLDRQVSLLEHAPERTARHAYAQYEGLSRLIPLTPSEAFDRLLPQNILPVPLMRALASGNWDMALRLGALTLVEEDVALLGAFCTSGMDYGELLRCALDSAEGIAT